MQPPRQKTSKDKPKTASKVKGKRRKVYKLISPEGKIVKVTSHTKLVKETGLAMNALCQLTIGRACSVKGWYSTSPKSIQWKKYLDNRTIVNLDTGERKQLGFRECTQFAKDHNMSHDRLYRLLTGKKIAYMNWVLAKTYDLVHTRVPVDGI